ncbi:NfeD family protein [Desulfosporosinus meridiei]|uniref:Membrane-bound serine protease (ClpP class) n=1 Tax=Desulfosporosinus meridiei (strain ATCC BAA-275 / DSM 13257 / KCTC 12902 / NCIMB 13706 / S10) TaxID=768704 RepID=J7IX51_DESMD|nr:NfeD family protein [Desulfosporosinus meridiei]AFQ46397.1 membrane-bound serine protease (ClpP class) [Desulfosporosinus meridiei DSM 13257]
MSQSIIIALILLGIALLAIEIFVIPGFGVSGILGIAALISGIFLVTDSFLEGLLFTAGALIVLGILIYLSFKSPRTQRLWKKFSLSTRQTPKEGYVAPKPQYEMYLGQVGIALTQLRPAGTGDFDGVKLDVVTEGGFIGLGTTIKIIGVEGSRIIVREEKL